MKVWKVVDQEKHFSSDIQQVIRPFFVYVLFISLSNRLGFHRSKTYLMQNRLSCTEYSVFVIFEPVSRNIITFNSHMILKEMRLALVLKLWIQAISWEIQLSQLLTHPKFFHCWISEKILLLPDLWGMWRKPRLGLRYYIRYIIHSRKIKSENRS